MIAFAVGGTPVTTFIGTDENNLSWTVTEPVGSRLVLSVVDANGSAGGIPPQILTVIAGQSTQCVTAPLTTPPFTVTANVTSELTTCQPWGLTVKGGVPPYTVTLAELNEPVVTNVTMPFGLDSFTFINRANPNGQLIAGISDFTGRWASGTPIVNTQGSADVSCVGLVSSSGNSTLIQQQENAANAASQSTKRHRSAIIAVAVILVLLVLMGLGAATFFHRRKREREAQAELAQALPTQYVEPESKMLSSSNRLVSKKAALALQEAQNSNAAPGVSPSSSSQTLPTAPVPYFHAGSATATLTNPSNAQRPGSRVSNSGFVNFPATSIRRSAKPSEAIMTSTPAPDSEYPEAGPAPSKTQGDPLTVTNVGEEAVFQHRDAGVVRELPPPYRARRSRPSSS
jgi:hypothetical protein